MPLRVLILALLAAFAQARAADDRPWGYVIGEARVDQQGNFCDRREDVNEIAAIFERFGPRTGFSALAAAPGCSLAMLSFTPHELIREVVVPLAAGGEYRVRFIRVQLVDEEDRYLVTTRHLSDGR